MITIPLRAVVPTFVMTMLLLLALGGAAGYVLGRSSGIQQARHARQAIRPLPVSWSNFGTCGAEALGDNFVRWTCRIEQ